MKKTEPKYSFAHYFSLERWISFYYQIQIILNCSPQKMLEVGKGSGWLENFIRNQTNISYQSLDLDRNLQPNLLGSVTAIPAPDASFDLVVAFEVLEHLPFDNFELALTELKRVSRRYVAISLPDARSHLRFSSKIPLLPKVQLAIKIPWSRRPQTKGEHFWEIGEKGFNCQKILTVLKRHFKIRQDFIPYENQFHHFYLLEKNGS